MVVEDSKRVGFQFSPLRELSLLSVLFTFICIFLFNWTDITTDSSETSVGLFFGTGGHLTTCNTDTSALECTYLIQSQRACVISLIFGFLASLILVMHRNQKKDFAGFRALLVTCFAGFEFAFGLVCLVLWSYYNKTYLSGPAAINVEYPDNRKNEYSSGFYLMIASVIISALASILGFRIAYMTKKLE